MLLSVRAESNQWPRPPSLAPLGQFTLRRAKGAPSTNTWLTPVFIGVAPLDPHYGGTPSCQIGRILPAARTQDLASSLPRPTGAYLVRNFKVSALCGHRLLWQNRGSWSTRPPPHPTGRQAPGGVR